MMNGKFHTLCKYCLKNVQIKFPYLSAINSLKNQFSIKNDPIKGIKTNLPTEFLIKTVPIKLID